MALKGASLQEIMLRSFWKKQEAAEPYTGWRMPPAIASKLGAGVWGEAEGGPSRVVPLDFLVG